MSENRHDTDKYFEDLYRVQVFFGGNQKQSLFTLVN